MLQDTFITTLAAHLFRALMAIITTFDLETRQFDAVNAFANSPIDEPTYCKLPAGWEGDQSLLLLLQQALYRLKQSPALWYCHLSSTLTDLRLESVSGVQCLHTNQHMLVFFFVNNIIIIYNKKFTCEVNEFEKRLCSTYKMRRLRQVEWFLEINITHKRHSQCLWLCQESYIDKIMTKFNISNTMNANTLD